MNIVFHGENACSFSEGFQNELDAPANITLLPDRLESDADRKAYADADVIIGVKFDTSLPVPARLGLFHVPGAGYDAVDLEAVPASAVVCNCFGHEQAIAEYVFASILDRHVPLRDADMRLRAGDWSYTSGAISRAHDEIAGKTIGLLGFGHIGKAIAKRAKAFEMDVIVANRSPVELSPMVNASFTLDALVGFWPAADFIVVSIPSTPETKRIVGRNAFTMMRSDAVIMNVGRGATIDEDALYEALENRSIGGAVIDTWYKYPAANQQGVMPSTKPFHQLSNIVMTPHMSGWTLGTIRRRKNTIADNINRTARGESCVNIVRDSVR
ncbi:phosphoglycerate dehydrogenase [Brucella endophytica]|uniref:Phosphoglycerate dehydrogenase n=2 Tax=Brucella endophytica TaxID=1963359 RepID=A0A916SK95_9HYPH|nr:2-hydroxyacid dehydrogenase [Brucella endophytica]GGB04536.1 phosphoglycerate dehydrogenase [Brucella endophytica]